SIPDTGSDLPLARADVEIRIDRFLYPATPQPILEDIHLQVPAGTTLGIVGHTGAGKTTLLNLLLRLYEGEGVTLRLGGQDIRGYSLAALRQCIACVPQDPLLFSATI